MYFCNALLQVIEQSLFLFLPRRSTEPGKQDYYIVRRYCRQLLHKLAARAKKYCSKMTTCPINPDTVPAPIAIQENSWKMKLCVCVFNRSTLLGRTNKVKGFVVIYHLAARNRRWFNFFLKKILLSHTKERLKIVGNHCRRECGDPPSLPPSFPEQCSSCTQCAFCCSARNSKNRFRATGRAAGPRERGEGK